MKIFELINFFSQKYHQRGFWGLIKRAYSKIITNNFIYFDEYLNNIKFHFKSKKKTIITTIFLIEKFLI